MAKAKEVKGVNGTDFTTTAPEPMVGEKMSEEYIKERAKAEEKDITERFASDPKPEEVSVEGENGEGKEDPQ